VTTTTNALTLVAHLATIILAFVDHRISAEMPVWLIPNARILASYAQLESALFCIFVELFVMWILIVQESVPSARETNASRNAGLGALIILGAKTRHAHIACTRSANQDYAPIPRVLVALIVRLRGKSAINVSTLNVMQLVERLVTQMNNVLDRKRTAEVV